VRDERARKPVYDSNPTVDVGADAVSNVDAVR
jgi:hypothetical protein